MVLAQLDHLSQAIDALGKGHAGRVAIGSVLTGSSYLVPAAIARLWKNRPSVRIKIVEGVSGELIPRLISGEPDFLIGRLSDVGSSVAVSQEALFSALFSCGFNRPTVAGQGRFETLTPRFSGGAPAPSAATGR
jgi:DNA-binding transcriptional LysR family regulator